MENVVQFSTARGEPQRSAPQSGYERMSADKTVVLTATLNPESVTAYLREGLRDVQPKPYLTDEVAALLK